MKKTFLTALIFLLFGVLGIQTVSAQAEQPFSGTSTPQSIDLPTLDYRYNAVIEFFLQKLQEKDFQTAYSYMAGNFPSRNSPENFTNLVTQAGLTDFTTKKWLSFKDEMKNIGITTLVGEFTTSDDVIHKITFYFVIGGETEIKIGDIIEEITVADLSKRFPDDAALNNLVKNDLTAITRFIKSNKAKKAFLYLSPQAQKRIKLRDMRKAINQFRKQRIDPRLRKNTAITMDENFPQLSSDGLMLVQGNYKNRKYNVSFVLGYDYMDWRWQLGLFSINAQKKRSHAQQ